MFHETLIEPTAYQHFVSTGEFREGTMLVLILHAVEEGALPSRHGQHAAAVHGVEMAVKDHSRVPEGWAYYGFGDAPRAGVSTAQPNPEASCHSCHAKNAARDNVLPAVLFPALRVPLRRHRGRGSESRTMNCAIALPARRRSARIEILRA